MSSELVVTEVLGPVAVITLNRPEKRNALSAELVVDLGDAVEVLDQDPAIHAMVLTGADPAFSAGFDLRNLGTELAETRARRWEGEVRRLGELAVDGGVVRGVEAKDVGEEARDLLLLFRLGFGRRRRRGGSRSGGG